MKEGDDRLLHLQVIQNSYLHVHDTISNVQCFHVYFISYIVCVATSAIIHLDKYSYT